MAYLRAVARGDSFSASKAGLVLVEQERVGGARLRNIPRDIYWRWEQMSYRAAERANDCSVGDRWATGKQEILALCFKFCTFKVLYKCGMRAAALDSFL